MRKWLESEAQLYDKPIKIAEKDIPQAMLQFIDKATGKPGETVFPNYFPIKMLKDMLSENGFKVKKNEEL